MYYCLLCDFDTPTIDVLIQHLADVHDVTTPDVEFCGINEDGVVYVGDVPVNLVGLVLKGLEDELTRHTSPVTRIDVAGNIVVVDHEDGTTTTVDLVAFLDKDHVGHHVRADPFGVALRVIAPYVDQERLHQVARDWLVQNRQSVFAPLLHKLEVLSRVLEARGPLNQNMTDLLWQDTTVIESMLPPTFPGTADLNLALDWWLHDLTSRKASKPISEEGWRELAKIVGRAWTTIRDRYYGSYQTHLLQKAIDQAKQNGTTVEDELNRLKYYRP